ncbi:hypothetical protein [Chitinophaga sp.]|uniref:hypothetical protein n=1 Tax=Chitinophaga sp. TaxID=1869181 RepID=UPI0031DBDEC9
MKFNILDKGGRWIFYYLISSVVFAGGSHLIAYISRNNMWFFTPMSLIQFLILTIFFYHVIKNQLIRKILLIVLGLITCFATIDFFFLEGPMAYNSYSLSIENLLLLLYSVIYFWELMRDEDLVKQSIFVNNLPNFWYNSGLFIFHCSNFMLSLAYNFLQHTHFDRSIQNATLSVTFIGGFAEVVLIYIGLLKAQKFRS